MGDRRDQTLYGQEKSSNRDGYIPGHTTIAEVSRKYDLNPAMTEERMKKARS